MLLEKLNTKEMLCFKGTPNDGEICNLWKFQRNSSASVPGLSDSADWMVLIGEYWHFCVWFHPEGQAMIEAWLFRTSPSSTLILSKFELHDIGSALEDTLLLLHISVICVSFCLDSTASV